ncbi:MAG: zinc dependent phospholipase C family protein [Deltaproteobacteria bacterium]|nr:zinc dependent phospholipase C family protein [Deltaproteobacteria bacterium]
MVSFLVISFVGLFVLLIPEYAYAWGPATHIYYGMEVLKDLSVLSPVVASILKEFPYDFLYGCISADITVGKKYVEYRKHCHNWNVGFRILHEAHDLSQKAFALGYLSHLAADTVAHNFFVPGRMIRSYSKKPMGHTYWEIRADSLVGQKYWQEGGRISKKVQQRHDPLIRNIIERTLFSFEVNKTIFNSILMIHRFKHWRRMVRKIGARSRWVLGLEDIEKYHHLSKLSILDLLISMQDAECYKLDPTGRANFKRARELRKSLRRIAPRSRLNEETYHAVVRQLPVQVPPLY